MTRTYSIALSKTGGIYNAPANFFSPKSDFTTKNG